MRDLSRRSLIGASAAALLAGSAGAWPIGVGRPSTTATRNLIEHGDSITLGVGVTTAYGPRLATKLNLAHDIIVANTSIAWNGQGYNYVYATSGSPNNLVQDLAVSVQPAMSGTLPNWLVTFAGSNDLVLGGSSVAQLEGYFQAYLTAAQTIGFSLANIVAVCMLPRQNYSETNRSAWNAYLVAQAASQGFLVARTDLDPCIGAAGQQFNATYFQSDTIHPADFGQQIIAEIVDRSFVP